MSRNTRTRRSAYVTKKQMVFNLLSLNRYLSAQGLIANLARTGTRISKSAAYEYRDLYFAQPNRQSTPTVATSLPTNNTVTAIRKLIEGVRAVGGKKNAAEIVSLLS